LLRRILGRRREVKVQFPSDRDVFAALRGDLSALVEMRGAANSGDLERARRLLMIHLSDRSEPRFFVDTSNVRSLASDFGSRHPEWHTEVAQWASGWKRCIGVAGDRLLGSEDAPDWNNLPFGPGRDNVYQYRPHYFLVAVQLARARAYGAETGIALKRLIESWFGASDGRAGALGYGSPLVAVHRAVALTWTGAFLAGCERRDFDLEFKILRILLADARFVHARLGTSFPNNHLLADGFLMLYLGLLYPEFREAANWKREGEAVFHQEFRRQVYEDGTSFEHAVHYHEMVCEMVTAYVLLARRNGVAIERWVEERHRRMLEFQAALGGPEAKSFDIGDTVEGHLFPLDGFEGVGAAGHREILRALYDPAFPPSRPSAPGLERAQWLLGRALETPSPRSADQGSFAFPHGGYFILPDAVLDGCMVFRSGPAPQALCNPGHMHADFLSVYLRVHGTPVLVDAGTFTYRSRKERWPADEPEWRAHFMSAAAHNTLCIDGQDPLARGRGDFPSGPLASRVVGRPLTAGAEVAWTEATVASDTAYSGYTRGVLHVGGRYWLFYDVLPEAAIAEKAWLALQFTAEASLRKLGDSALVATVPSANLLVASSRSLQGWEVFQGSRTPLAGWISPRYGELAPAPACRVVTTGGAPALATLLEPVVADPVTPSIDLEGTETGILGVRIAKGQRVDYILLSRDREGQRASAFGIDLEGTALWLRVDDGRLRELRILAGRKASSTSLSFAVTSRRGPRDLRLIFGQDARHGLAADETDVEVTVH